MTLSLRPRRLDGVRLIPPRYGQFRRLSRDGAQLQLHDDDLTALVDGYPVSGPRPPVSVRQPVAQVPVARSQVHLRNGAREVSEAPQS